MRDQEEIQHLRSVELEHLRRVKLLDEGLETYLSVRRRIMEFTTSDVERCAVALLVVDYLNEMVRDWQR